MRQTHLAVNQTPKALRGSTPWRSTNFMQYNADSAFGGLRAFHSGPVSSILTIRTYSTQWKRGRARFIAPASKTGDQ